MAHSEACQLFIEEQIREGLAEGKTPYSIGKELTAMIERLFEASIPAKTIAKRAEREKTKLATNVANQTIKPNNSSIPEKQEFQTVTVKPEPLPSQKAGPGRPPKFVATTPSQRPVFNQTNDNIEWARWTWNPVTGCEHGCPYCYARDIAARFYKPEIGFKPHFYPNRLEAPCNMPSPPKGCEIGERNVFTVSMGDLFGEWVPQEWIDSVLDAVRRAPAWNFLFLTKNPARYLTIDFPENAWVGATADTQARADEALEAFLSISNGDGVGKRPPVLFLSIEPMRERINLEHLQVVDWLIIGGQSQPGNLPPLQPEWEWVESVLSQARAADCKVYFKPNLIVRPREYPQ